MELDSTFLLEKREQIQVDGGFITLVSKSSKRNHSKGILDSIYCDIDGHKFNISDEEKIKFFYECLSWSDPGKITQIAIGLCNLNLDDVKIYAHSYYDWGAMWLTRLALETKDSEKIRLVRKLIWTGIYSYPFIYEIINGMRIFSVDFIKDRITDMHPHLIDRISDSFSEKE